MSYRATSFSFLFLGVCFLIGGVFYAPAKAHAGFQWVSPEAAAAVAPVAPAPASAPAPQRLAAPEVISPTIIEGTTAPAPLAAPAPAPTADAAPMQLAAPEPAPTPSVPALMPPSEKVVSGFANKVPLAVALRQVMPSDFGFSVDSDVTLSTPVSWRGGRPWRTVLGEMLQASGMSFREDGQMVRIVRADGAALPEGEVPAMLPMASAAPAPTSTLSLPEPAPAPMLQPMEEPAPAPMAAPMPAPKAKAAPAPAPTRFKDWGPIAKSVPEHTLQLPKALPAKATAEVDPSSVISAEVWTATRGSGLRRVVEDWSRRAHVELNWLSEYDYPIQATLTITGTFEEAVRNLLAGFQEAQPQPVARLHNNPSAGQMVLVVETRGNNYND